MVNWTHLFPLNRTAEKFSVLEYCNKKQKRCPDVRAKVESVKDAKERGDPWLANTFVVGWFP